MKDKFKICLTMAGAVSAGAYTAGVLDYLFETLELWENAKNKNRMLGETHSEYDHSVPMHDVEIDIISGTSAGGMAGSILILGLLANSLKPVKRKDIENDTVQNNILYDLWVNMVDDSNKTTFERLLEISDLIHKDSVSSILNSKPIIEIATRAFNRTFNHELPNYMSKELDLILTVTSLEGLKFKLNFSGNSNKQGVSITTHDGFLRYRFNKYYSDNRSIDKGALYYNIDLDKPEDINTLQTATMSTGAFPIGFSPHSNIVAKKFLDEFPKFIFSEENAIITPVGMEDLSKIQFTAIDGGVVNNEPYGLTMKVLKQKNATNNTLATKKYAILMIDPFPSLSSPRNSYESIKDLGVLNIAKRMFKALRNQALFNQKGIGNALNEDNQEHFLISPTRAKNQMGNKVWNALACGAIGGFSGFIDIEFRKHDFQLGRQNCQTALRYYFALEKEHAEERLHYDMDKDSSIYKRFHFKNRSNNSEMFPIIPDMKVIQAVNNTYDYPTYGTEAELGYKEDGTVILPEFPQMNFDRFKKENHKHLKTRIANLIKILSGRRWMSWVFKRKVTNSTWDIIKSELSDQKLLKD